MKNNQPFHCLEWHVSIVPINVFWKSTSSSMNCRSCIWTIGRASWHARTWLSEKINKEISIHWKLTLIYCWMKISMLFCIVKFLVFLFAINHWKANMNERRKTRFQGENSFLPHHARSIWHLLLHCSSCIRYKKKEKLYDLWTAE